MEFKYKMELNYGKAYEYLKQYAKENNAKYFEIVEDNYEYEYGLLLIVYHDKKCEHEDYHICVDVSTM